MAWTNIRTSCNYKELGSSMSQGKSRLTGQLKSSMIFWISKGVYFKRAVYRAQMLKGSRRTMLFL